MSFGLKLVNENSDVQFEADSVLYEVVHNGRIEIPPAGGNGEDTDYRQVVSLKDENGTPISFPVDEIFFATNNGAGIHQMVGIRSAGDPNTVDRIQFRYTAWTGGTRYFKFMILRKRQKEQDYTGKWGIRCFTPDGEHEALSSDGTYLRFLDKLDITTTYFTPGSGAWYSLPPALQPYETAPWPVYWVIPPVMSYKIEQVEWWIVLIPVFHATRWRYGKQNSGDSIFKFNVAMLTGGAWTTHYGNVNYNAGVGTRVWFGVAVGPSIPTVFYY